MKPAAVGLGAFVAAFALDLLTKVYVVVSWAAPRAVVYNQRPHDLALRIDVSLLTLAIVFGYFSDPRGWVRTLLTLSAIPVAIVTNGFRVAGTGIASSG